MYDLKIKDKFKKRKTESVKENYILFNGEELQKVLRYYNISQRAIAKEVGKSNTYISMILKEGCCKMDLLENIMNAITDEPDKLYEIIKLKKGSD